MYKSLIIFVTMASSFLTTQCASTKNKDASQEAELSQPEFVTKTAYFNTFTPSRKGGRTGYEIHFEQFELPETMMLQQVYFSGHTGKVIKTKNGYIARVLKIDTDVIMSSDPKEEAANTPPILNGSFPFTIDQGQLGVQYIDNGVVKYALMDNILQREPIYYPSAPSKAEKQ